MLFIHYARPASLRPQKSPWEKLVTTHHAKKTGYMLNKNRIKMRFKREQTLKEKEMEERRGRQYWESLEELRPHIVEIKKELLSKFSPIYEQLIISSLSWSKLDNELLRRLEFVERNFHSIDNPQKLVSAYHHIRELEILVKLGTKKEFHPKQVDRIRSNIAALYMTVGGRLK